ncbi:MAG: response regulator, partial [Candidatus Tectomicrobia bacterium]|nr:response regulator [Candidatus Tectomicrobia bacterium]
GGLELCQKIREEETQCQIPIILLSSNFEDFVWEEAQAAGASSYLTKPFEAKHLLEKIKEFLPPDHEIPEPDQEQITGEAGLPAGELGPQWVETVREAIATQVQEIASKHILEMAERHMQDIEPEIRQILENVVREVIPHLAPEIIREAIDTQVREMAAKHIREIAEKRMQELEPEIRQIVESFVREVIPRLAEEIIRQEIEKIKTGTA